MKLELSNHQPAAQINQNNFENQNEKPYWNYTNGFETKLTSKAFL